MHPRFHVAIFYAGDAEAAAQDPRAPDNVKRFLARHQHFGVRMDLGTNERLPPDVVKLLAADDYEQVRRVIAANPNTPAAVLKVLVRDAHPDVVQAAVENPNTAVGDVKYALLSAYHDVPNLRRAIFAALRAGGETATRPGPILDEFAMSPDVEIRRRVAEHELTSLSTLRRLTQDRDADTRDLANGALLHRGHYPVRYRGDSR